jgi:alkane 1-monooxygenase
MKPWSYLMLLFVPGLVITGYFLGHWWNFLVPVFCFVAYPIVNIFIPVSPHKNSVVHSDTYPSEAYTGVAFCFVPVLIVLTAWSVYTAGHASISPVSFAGLAVSIGIINGLLGFTLAHEFIHRFGKTEQIAGYLLLLQNNYMHYAIEHVWGHHVYACTPEDPHTARLGESLYRYLPRAIRLTYNNAWKIEQKKLFRSFGSSPLIYNRILLFAALQIMLMLTILFFFGTVSLLFFLMQNAVAIVLLHIINYLQHYGLMRQKNLQGNYERLDVTHAWNAGHHGKSFNIFQLENHADHHMHPGRSFEKLTHHKESPEHPAGYSFMILLCVVPPLWFHIMNKKIASTF